MHILDIEIGQTVKLNRSPTYGEASDYLHCGMSGTVEEIDREEHAIAVNFGRFTMIVCSDDVDPVLH